MSKQKYYNNHFAFNLSNVRKVWKGINEIIKNFKVQSQIVLDVNGNLVIDPKRVANVFNKFFSNIAEELVSKIENPPTKYQDYLKNPNQSSIFLTEVDHGEVFSLFSKLNATKSGDIYGIHPFFIKTGSFELTAPLTRIFNLSLRTGVFPNCWKVAQIIPIHKKELRDIVSNYRPISLLPIFGKILEK